MVFCGFLKIFTFLEHKNGGDTYLNIRAREEVPGAERDEQEDRVAVKRKKSVASYRYTC